MNSTVTIQTVVSLQNIRPVSDLRPHMEVAKNRIIQIKSYVVCAVHTVIKPTDLSHIGIWATFACTLNIGYDMQPERQSQKHGHLTIMYVYD